LAKVAKTAASACWPPVVDHHAPDRREAGALDPPRPRAVLALARGLVAGAQRALRGARPSGEQGLDVEGFGSSAIWFCDRSIAPAAPARASRARSSIERTKVRADVALDQPAARASA
jgi:hypothetical protein